jgi:ATPase subunit of ABC transporter with duplicated ATPase domains
MMAYPVTPMQGRLVGPHDAARKQAADAARAPAPDPAPADPTGASRAASVLAAAVARFSPRDESIIRWRYEEPSSPACFLLGDPGSGKSTLLGILVHRLIPRAPAVRVTSCLSTTLVLLIAHDIGGSA